MKIEVRHLGGVQFEIAAGKHRVICDQPASYGGQDEGVTPPDFLLASIGSCAAYYAAEYLRVRGLAGEGLSVAVEAEKLKAPARLGNFRVTIQAPGDFDERHREGLVRAARSCLIHNTLLHPPSIEIAVETPALCGVDA